MGFQRLKRRVQKSKRPTKKNQRGASFLKSWACSETMANLLFQICPHLSHATSALDGISEIEEAIPDIERHLLFQTCQHLSHVEVSFAEITGSLSKRRFQISKRHLIF
ncbi:hypothetical protein ACFX2I_019276 [Malus domestica]